MKTKLTILQAFNAMTKFLDDYYKRTSCTSEDIRKLLNNMQFSKDNNTKDPNIWKLWVKYTNEVLTEPKNSKYLLRLTK